MAGPIIAVEIGVHPALAAVLTQQGQPVPATVNGTALIDTGATVTAIHAPILQQLAIQPVGTMKVGTAGGQQDQSRYPAAIRFAQINVQGSLAFVLGADLTGMGFIALIGRDILAQGILVYNGALGHFILAF